MLLSQPALSRMVDRLADRGLVSRTTDPSDGRGVRLALTEDGRAVQRRIGRRHARSVARAMLAGLTPAELRQLEELCAKLATATPRHPVPDIRIMTFTDKDQNTMSETFNLVVVSAGTSDPSSTRMLADRTAQRVAALAAERGATVGPG